MELNANVAFVNQKGKSLRRVTGPGVSSIPRDREYVLLVSKTGAHNWYKVVGVIHRYETFDRDTYHAIVVVVKPVDKVELQTIAAGVVEFAGKFT